MVAQLLTLQDVAERLQVSVFAVREYIKVGRLRAHKVGKFWRVAEQDLQGYLEATASRTGGKHE
jgi:excisionase family DNA binding protein